MIDSKKLLVGVAVVAGGYLLLSGKGAEALTGGSGKPLAQTGILPGQGNGAGSFVFPGDTFKGFAPIERTKIRLPESPFIPYPTPTPPHEPYYEPGKVDDGDDGKPPVVTKPGGFEIMGGSPWISKKTIEEGLGSTIVEESPILSFFGWVIGKVKRAKIESGVREGTPGAKEKLAAIERAETKKEAIARGMPTGGEMPASVRIMLAESKLRKTAAPGKTETKKEHRLVVQAKTSQAYRSGRVTFGRGITGGN